MGERIGMDLPPAWAMRLGVLLDALEGVDLSLPERASLALIAGQEAATVEHLAAVIRRARRDTAEGVGRDE